MKKEDIINIFKSRGVNDFTSVNLDVISNIVFDLIQPYTIKPEKIFKIIIINKELLKTETEIVGENLILSEIINLSHMNMESAIFVNKELVYQGELTLEEIDVLYGFINE